MKRKKPKIQTGYQVINALDMLHYVEEVSQRKGLEHRLWSKWEFSNDSYQRPWNIDLEDIKEGIEGEWETQEHYDDIQAILKEFPEIEDSKTLLWVCW
jgi:hypothetical protein